MTDAKILAERRRPHPQNPPRTVKLKCLGCGKPFMSTDKACNRQCTTCARHSDGIMSGGGSIGSSWHRGRAGA